MTVILFTDIHLLKDYVKNSLADTEEYSLGDFTYLKGRLNNKDILIYNYKKIESLEQFSVEALKNIEDELLIINASYGKGLNDDILNGDIIIDDITKGAFPNVIDGVFNYNPIDEEELKIKVLTGKVTDFSRKENVDDSLAVKEFYKNHLINTFISKEYPFILFRVIKNQKIENERYNLSIRRLMNMLKKAL